jgi:hypothetical protein
MSQIKVIDGKIEIIFVQKLLFSKTGDWLKFVPLWPIPTKPSVRPNVGC